MASRANRLGEPGRLRWLLALALALPGLYFAWRAWQTWAAPVVVIEWSTASELDTVGYNLYRSQSPQGPFDRINPELIPGSADPLTGGQYTYADRAVQAGTIYYYELEDIDSGGFSSRHGPIEGRAERTLGVEAVLALALLGGAALLGYLFLPVRPNGQEAGEQS
jgi:hypothetical protein